MPFYTRSQILSNRRAWIDFLKLETTKKGKRVLERVGDNESRCCLGHACHVLIPELRRTSSGLDAKVFYGTEWAYAPAKIVGMLGLYSQSGEIKGSVTPLFNIIGATCPNLAEYNDCTDITPQQIGSYLESVIEGGPDTPFEPLSNYATEV